MTNGLVCDTNYHLSDGLHEPRPLGGYNFGYVDGHAGWVSEDVISECCIWNLQSSPDDYSKEHLK